MLSFLATKLNVQALIDSLTALLSRNVHALTDYTKRVLLKSRTMVYGINQGGLSLCCKQQDYL